MKRAAFLEARADYFGRAFSDGIVRALLAAGYAVDLFAPDGAGTQELYGANVVRRDIEYRRGWLLRNAALAFRYDLFVGGADLPMAFAGVLAAIGGKLSVVACDEIYVGGYEGDARSYWKRVAQWAMRRADLTVITDLVRLPLQREYAKLRARHPTAVLPCCFTEPYAGRSRADARRALGIADDDFVLSFTGAFTASNGADWLIRFLDRSAPHVRVLVQTGGRPDAVLDALLQRLDREGRVIYRPDRVSYLDAAAITVAADAAIVFYLSPKPQFQLMGLSSQKLCTAFWLGIPVIATRQPSFAFIDELACGVTIAGEDALDAAVARIAANHDAFVRNAADALTQIVRPGERLRVLTESLRAL
jgi:glycosyltransferase involved in cell wall biosynthesis